MNKSKLHLAMLAIVIAGGIVVTSCKKKDTTTTPTTTDTDQSGATANNKTEEISSDIVSMGSEACDKTGNMASYRTASSEQASQLSCATVTVDTINKVVTVTFTGGVCLDGKIRNGSLIYNYSASPAGARHYRDPGFTVSITSSNYSVDNNTVTIVSKVITNLTPVGFNPASTNESWSINANMSVALSGGGSVSWTCARVKTLLNTSTAYTNANTPITWSTARIGYTGSASGSRSNGETFTVNITNQLIRDFGACTVAYRHPFIQGTFVYAPSNKAARTVDYGTGTCDLDATVTINGITHQIIL